MTTPTLSDRLKKAGYYTAIRGKVTPFTPYNPYPGWDRDLTIDADGKKLHLEGRAVLRSPRPPVASPRPGRQTSRSLSTSTSPIRTSPSWHPGDKHPASKEFIAKDVPVPGFLFDHPDIRKELALYYTSVRRADDAVGSILKALRDSGQVDNTVVVFLSDHGMPLPFAKTRCGTTPRIAAAGQSSRHHQAGQRR